MRKIVYGGGLLLAMFLTFTTIAGAQGVQGPLVFKIVPDVVPMVNLEPLALPDAAVTAAAPPSWLPKLPLIRATTHFRFFERNTQEPEGTARARSDSLSSFDVPNVRFYFTGEAFRGLSYQLAFRVSGDNNNEFLKDAYFDWKPNALFGFVPSEFGILMGKMPDSLGAGRASSHVNRLQGADAPFGMGPAALSSVRVHAVKPYMSFWDDRINTSYEITPAGAASGTLTNTKNDWRHTVGLSISPLGKFPIGPATENDLRHSPFAFQVGYGYTRTYEQYFRCLTAPCATGETNNKDTAANYHALDAVSVWQGLFLWWNFVLKDGFDDKTCATLAGASCTPKRFNGGGRSYKATVSYAIPTPWGDLTPWYQYAVTKPDDRNILRNSSSTGNVSGALIDIGGAATETIGGLTRTAQFKDHFIGLNLYLAGENLALKPYVRVDTLRKTTWFIFQLQHQFFFNPEGKYR